MSIYADTPPVLQSESGPLRRIHIVGGPGSGKSTLARQLGIQLSVPVYELDKLSFEGPRYTKRPLELRLADLHAIAIQPAWITEGIFVGWTDELLQASDLIIWLDHVSWPVAYQRIVLRFTRWGVREAGRHTGVRKVGRFRDYSRHLRHLAGVFFSSRAYYAATAFTESPDPVESRHATAYYLERYRPKTIHCLSNDDIQHCVNRIARTFTPQPVVPA